jgi:AAA domain/Relaxase/Mobilisation nuclease domain
MIVRIRVGKGITGTVRYILGEGRHPETGAQRKLGPDQLSRVEWFGGVNFGFEIETKEDADVARKFMEFAALNQRSRTKRCEKDCVHLSLSWKPGEQPTREQMEFAVRDALKSIGMENATALFSSHNDEDYRHVHIVASKINPSTGRAYDLKGDYLKLSRWAERYERDHSGGIVCTRREDANRLRDAIDRRDAGASLELMTEQRPTFTQRDLNRVLSKQIKGEFSRAQFAEAIVRHPDAVGLRERPDGPVTRYTAKQVLEAEAYVLRATDILANSSQFLVGDRLREAVLSRSGYEELSDEKRAAVLHATGKSGLALIEGQAGTGKSFTMCAIRQVYEAKGYKVAALAWTNKVVLDMRLEGFSTARTITSELYTLNNERTRWDQRTVVMVDEAAMVDTRSLALITAHAQAAGAKLILVGDDRQLSSIERGGMFGVLKDRYGSAVLSTVFRQHKHDDRRAAELMAEGNFHTALEIFEAKKAIRWTRSQPEARSALVAQWIKDHRDDPLKSRLVFAYTNEDVDRLNHGIREALKAEGLLQGASRAFDTKHGRAEFTVTDRIQFTETDKPKGLVNGAAGTVHLIQGSSLTVKLDGRRPRFVTFDADELKGFRHGYAGTIYKGQGATLDQTYLYHSEHWRSAISYVALTRHRDKTELFVARNTAPDLKQLARQIARVDDRRGASNFCPENGPGPVRPRTPRELAAHLGDRFAERLRSSASQSRDQRDTIKYVRPDGGEASQSRLQKLLNALRVDIPPERDPSRSNDDGGRERSR